MEGHSAPEGSVLALKAKYPVSSGGTWRWGCVFALLVAIGSKVTQGEVSGEQRGRAAALCNCLSAGIPLPQPLLMRPTLTTFTTPSTPFPCPVAPE